MLARGARLCTRRILLASTSSSIVAIHSKYLGTAVLVVLPYQYSRTYSRTTTIARPASTTAVLHSCSTTYSSYVTGIWVYLE